MVQVVAAAEEVVGGGGNGGGGGGGNPANPLVESWFTIISPLNSLLNFPTVVTFTANGQFTWVQTNPLTGQVASVQGSYTLGPLPTNSLIFLTLVVQGQIFLQGLFAQPGPGEFIIETFSLGALTGTGFILFNRQ